MTSPNTQYEFGTVKPAEPLTSEGAARLCKRAGERRAAIASYPIDKTLRILTRVAQVWSDPESPLRQDVQAALALETGFSAEMIRLGLDQIPVMLNADTLRQKLNTELGEFGRANGAMVHYNADTSTSLTWHPVGTVLHVLSGNVFLAGVGALVHGLLTGNVTLLKVSSDEPNFMPLFLRTLADVDDEGVVSGSIATLSYASSNKTLIGALQRGVDGIAIWGGEEAVKGYRDGLPARTRVMVFGPKISLALITDTGLSTHGVRETAQALAEQAAVWDQRACTAPQVCFVESRAHAEELAGPLAEALREITHRLPPGQPDFHTATEIRKFRGTFEISEIRGLSKLKDSGSSLDWTFAIDPDPTLSPSPLHRTIRIVPFDSSEVVLEQVRSLRGYVQTVGIVAARHEQLELGEKLASLGALRIVPLSAMHGGRLDDPHDGKFDLPEFMNLVTNRFAEAPDGPDAVDLMGGEAKVQKLNSLLRGVLDSAKAFPFYKERLEALTVDGLRDLAKIPVLTRDELEERLQPQVTPRIEEGGYMARSGGTSGAARFTYFNRTDWNAMIDRSVRVFRACGIEPGDRMANCMLAGDLYGSFVSLNAVNFSLGITSFAFAGMAAPESMIEVWRKFRFNAIQGVPSSLIPILRKAKEFDAEFAIEKVLFAGEPLSPHDRQWLVRELGVKRVASVIGVTEVGPLAYQCSEQSGAVHHLLDDYNYVEILDSDGLPVPDGEVGDIAVTTLQKHTPPLLRFLLGDRGRILPGGDCECGRRGRQVEYLGRSDNMLCMGQMNILFSDVSTALEPLGLSAVQMVADRNSGIDHLTVNIETTSPTHALSAQAREQLLSNVRHLRDHVELQKVRVTVNAHPLGSLPRNPRSGKLKPIVDERYPAPPKELK